MGRLLKSDPLDFIDLLEERRDDEVLGNILAPVGHKGGHANEMEAVNNSPVFKNSG